MRLLQQKQGGCQSNICSFSFGSFFLGDMISDGERTKKECRFIIMG